ncbi:MAG: DUF885 domain-containing protein [Chloroflexi bacterium]|nr:DUF885 domain-containing protein [Chloroflexota bacterium]
MTVPERADSPVNQLADRFWESILELNPTTATVYGDERYADRLEDPGPDGRARTRALMVRTAAEANAITAEGLPTEDRITRDMLTVIADLQIEEDDQALHQLRVVDQMSGPQQLLPQMTQFQPADTPERLEKFIGRLHAYPAFMAANAQILRDGMASGLTAPRIVAERTIAQMTRMLDVPIESALIPSMANVAGEADRERIRDVVRDVVHPADVAFLEVLRDEYLPATREEPGLWSAPNGEQLYRTAIRSWTTLELDPAAVHQIGLDELESVEAERRAIARAQGFGDDTVAYRAHLDADPVNQPATKDALVERARDDIERAMAAAPRYFGVLPRAHCDVRPVEEYKEKDAPFAYYYPPAPDGSRPGIYYANGYDLPSRKFTKLAPTTYHEAAPGHHFQITLEMENDRLITFRRLGARMVGGAYVEGWGLYAERLADEMGLYRDEAERFGMLDAQAWRAARLVVDTGLHALRWPRQRSIDFLRHAGLSETDAVIETDRYICWPGQALTYKTGQREIQRLRAELSARDGSAFDLRAFHDAVLGHGSLPLATLARELPNWLAAPV